MSAVRAVLPNPPPATVEILKGYESIFLELPVELTTPTGAAIVRHYVKDHGKAPKSIRGDLFPSTWTNGTRR